MNRLKNVVGGWSLAAGLLLLTAAALPAHAQFALISRGPIAGPCNPRTLGLDAVNNVVYSCGDAINGVSAQWAAIGGATACPDCIQAPGGNAAISGNFTAAELITSGLGAWNIVGGYGTLAVSPALKTMLGFGAGGIPEFSANGGTLTFLAYQDGSGNVAQNANTSTALAATPAQCAGDYATGITANGTANCSSSTYVLLIQQNCSALSGVSGYGLLCFDNSGALETNINNAGWAQMGYSILAQSSDTMIQSDGSTPQIYDLYAAQTSSFTNYNRLETGFDATNSNFYFASQSGGTPPDCSAGNCGFEWKIGATVKWEIDSLGRLKPFTDDTLDIGVSASLRPRDVFAGRAFRTGTSANTDSAGSCVLGTSCVITFVNTGYVSAPICVASDTTAIAATRVVVTTTTLTITGTGTDTIDYICIPRN